MHRENKNTRKSLILVASILSLSLLVVALLLVFKPQAEHKAVIVKAPQVEVVQVKQQPLQVPVYSRGVLAAEKQILLTTEISGKIIGLSPAFKTGGRFKQNDLLLKIDDREYQLAVVRAQAQVAAAQQVLKRVEAEAQQAKQDLQRLSSSALKNASPYALREPQLKEAQAKLKAARAELSLAKLRLEKTQIYAPFNGRILNKYVDTGQYVVTGSNLADIYNTDILQIALPLSLQQMDIILPQRQLPADKPLMIELSNNIAGKNITLQAHAIQLDSKVDVATQQLKLIANIDMSSHPDMQAILLPGLFVKAKILAPQKDALFVLPRQALHSNNELWLLNHDSRLQKQQVNVLYKNDRHIFIKGFLQDGQKVIVSAIDSPIAGMTLQEAAK